MKTKSIHSIAISVFIVLTLSSCASKLEEVNVKPLSVEISGEIGKYIQIVDNTYKIFKSSGKTMGGGYNYSISVNFINITPTDQEFDDLREMSLRVIDTNGMPIEIQEFEFDYFSESRKLENLLKTEGANDFLTFKGYAKKGTSIQKKGLPKPENIKGFTITSLAKVSKPRPSTSVPSTSSANISSPSKSSSKNWDKVLSDYEAYTDKYIKLLKKANAGDMSALTEYVEMLEKAQEFQESLEKASDDMSTAQMQRFMKIQTKLMNAASEL